jgi:hypothetical protein
VMRRWAWDRTPPARLAENGAEIIIEGPEYTDVLAAVHRRLRPQTYLEVGTWQGASLKLARCASLAIDPDFQLLGDAVGAKPACLLYQMTSDDFFGRNDPTQILGRPVDLAFLDALHVFDFVLRDFIATERHCRPQSIIALHDCLPRDYFMTRATYIPRRKQPTKYAGYWTGDVWKMIPVLREFRPDVKLVCLDAKPTGLAMCTTLDPANSSLSENYAEIIRTWRPVKLQDYGMSRLLDDCDTVASGAWLKGLKPLAN